uniref:Acyl carrier protein n=1 Tax=Leptolyngbya sp. ISBN3-Nov-94-8 TaxID=1798139 RepID=A0A125SL41_9CYAN|nr:acyl carrier protein [Leptolyngbya sp. ISBN3-Nov-94-8]
MLCRKSTNPWILFTPASSFKGNLTSNVSIDWTTTSARSMEFAPRSFILCCGSISTESNSGRISRKLPVTTSNISDFVLSAIGRSV